MAKPKRTKKQDYQIALNEIEDIKADEMRDLMNLNFKIKCKFKSKKQRELADTIKKNRITFVTGAPGTGKTIVTLKTGLELLKDVNSDIGNILLSTPIIEVGPSIGALPGDVDLKISQYFQHFYDNIEKLVGKKAMQFLKHSDLIEDKIINFVRGSTFGKLDDDGKPIGTFCILDESQNINVHQLKTFISRLGESSTMVILGDIEQCDIKLKKGEKSGLEDALTRFKDMEGIGYFEFTEDDIVRDKFLIDIMKRYKN